MTIDDHHDRTVIALNRSVIFLDNDDNAEPFNTATSGGEDDLETKSKNLHAADVIIRNLTLLRTKNAVGDSLQNLKASVQSCFRNGVDKNTTKDTTGAHSSNSSKHNDSSSSTLPLGLNQLNDFIIKAEYECNQDPYRGIGRLRQRQLLHQQTVHDQPSSRGEVVEDAVPTTGGPSLRETNGDKIPTPAVHQEDMYLSPLLWGTTTDPHELTLRTRSSRKKKNVSPWDACRWGILSTNDVVNDSGSDSQIEAEDTNHKLGPSSSYTSKESVGPFEPGNPENVVKCLTESCCPSLLAWTKQRIDQDFKTISQQNRKRRNVSKRSRSESDTGSTSVVEVQLGQRPSGSNYRCPCDSNPYCLTSLGGVVNDILMERCKDVTVKKIATEDDGNSKRNTVDNNDTKMHDNTRNGKRKKSDVVEKPKLLQKWLDKSLGPLKKKKGEELWYRNVASKVSNFSDTEDAPPDDDDDEVVVVVDAEVVVKSPTKVPTITDNTGGKEESNPISLHIRNTDAVAVPVGRDNSNSLENEWGKSHNLPNVAASVVPSSSCSHRMQTFVVTRLQSQSSNSQALNDKDNPGDIYFQTEEDEKTKQYSNETNYSHETQEELDRLRISQDLEREQIQKFVLSILERVQAIGGNVDDQDEPLWSLDEYLKAIVDWNRSLLFVSPIEQERQVGSLEITIGLPPGIQNLGATCYLNTQLQCLAQIPAFLDGIFSWRVVNSNHNMNPVMTNLQKLLAKMLVGGERKMSTQAFSDALGLEHHEQQDPNEFGRLLFDRMEESFQQCGSAANNGDYGNKKKDVGDLAHLLERIFRGTTTYETTCKNCGRTSARSEDFTDLNLPIVRRPSELDNDSVSDSFLNNDKSDQSVRTISRTKGFSKTAFGNNADTDVQYCFDKYAMAEVLEGDNQYHCSHCNSKQDAERVLKFTKLPPVLNVQLSRYVFDRVKFVKKKLMDKVLLPKTLTIGREVGSPAADPAMQLKEKRYVLCAVMRHHGTSAYSGHYIAEAIDWTTGLWYEFNDETVKVLPQGPSCSYIPIIMREGSSTDRDSISLENESVNFSNGSQVAYDGSISGSQDAYNMYYVDEDYLARNALNALVKRQMNILNTSVKDTQSENGVLGELIMERKTKYSVLSELCFNDWNTSDRLRRRRVGIRKFIFEDPSSLLVQDDENLVNPTCYWVDGDIFRRFLECTPDLDDHLRSRKALVCPESLLCSHGGLHPSIARGGKLLRKDLYNAYVSLLTGERKLLCDTGADSNASDVVGQVIEASTDLFCTKCSTSYQSALSKKLQYVKDVKDLYFALEEERGTAAQYSQLYYNASSECPEEQYAYVLSRSSTTSFKKKATSLMKSFAGFDEGGQIDRSSSSSSTAPLCGLDELDIESFFVGSGASSSTLCRELPESTTTNEIEKKFNDNITCLHGNCNDSHNKRLVRYVPWKTWSLVKKVFPDAVEHRRLRMSDEENNANPIFEDDGCPLCQQEKDLMKSLKNQIELWARETRDNPLLKKLLDVNRTAPREIAVHNFAWAQSGCRLVHNDDISNWRKSVMSAAKICKRKISDSDELKSSIENLAFPSYHATVLEFERDPVDRLLQSLRSLICCEHKLVIKGAVFQQSEDDGSDIQYSQLSPSIVVLSSDEYDAYISSLSNMLAILYQGNNYFGGDLKFALDENKLNKQIQRITEHSYHPKIATIPQNEDMMKDVLLLSLEGSSKMFSLGPSVCACEICLKEYGPVHQQNQSETDECVENVSDDSNEKANNFVGKLGSAASDPIVVESDNEEVRVKTHKIRVFEFEAASNVQDAADSLRQASGSPQNGETEILTPHSFLRRSARKRKTKFPAGCILREDSIEVSLDHNMAAVRLLLYEKCEVPLAESMVYVVNLSNSDPLIIDVTIALNEKSLEDIIDRTIDKNHADVLDPFENFMIVYKKLEKDDTSDLNATLMDSLIQAANLELSKISGDPKGKRKRQSERGFQGTLLQSSSSSATLNNSCESALDREVESGETKSIKRPRSDSIQVSEDEKDDQLQSQSESGDKNENLTDSSSDSTMRKNVGNHRQLKADYGWDNQSIERKVMQFSSSSEGVSEDIVNERCLPSATLVVRDRSRHSDGMEPTPDDRASRLPSNSAASNYQGASSVDQNRLEVEKDGQGVVIDAVAGDDGVLIRRDTEERVVLDEESVPSTPSAENPESDATTELGSEQAEKKMNYISMLASRLQEAAGVEDQGVCWDAVFWAIDKNPNSDDLELIDCAYAKLLFEQEEEE